jgi:hypothetical protein
MTNGERKVMLDGQILAVACPACHVKAGVGCLTYERHVFAVHGLGAPKLSFHPARIVMAQENEFQVKFGKLGATEKALILYYAYIMVCDSVASKSVAVLGKEFKSTDIQAFFANEAIKELKKDGLMR